MTTTVNLRKMLHRKAWEFCTPSTGNTSAGSWVDSDKSDIIPLHDSTYFVNGASGIFCYNADQDAWQQIPNSGIAGAFGAGSCGEFLALGMLGGSATSTVTAGTTTTLTTTRTLVRGIDGCKIRVVSGTGIGYNGVVTSTTLGTNSVITVTPANGVAFDATTVFEVYSGSLWFFNAGSSAVGFSVYDRATNAWTAKSVTNLPTAWGTSGQLVGTPGINATFDSGTGIAGSTSTTLNTSKTYLLNSIANSQIRITAGTGNGQVRTISSNTAGANSIITVSSSWTVTPDTTSVFAIEGNSDYLYLMGNNAVATYRYSISANTWTLLAPTSARAGGLGAGGTADWIDGVTTWSASTVGISLFQNGSITKQNGRFILSFRGGATSNLDVYDISLNTWVAVATSYGNALETFSTGSCSVDMAGSIYIQKEGTGRIFRFDVNRWVLEPYATNSYMQSTTVEGDKMFVQRYTDGGTAINILYTQHHSRNELLRMLDI